MNDTTETTPFSETGQPTGGPVSGPDIMELLRRGRPIRRGRPVELREFDRTSETIVLAFDPKITPEPAFELLDGFRAGEKVLTMNGTQMLRIPDAYDVTLADFNLVEAKIHP